MDVADDRVEVEVTRPSDPPPLGPLQDAVGADSDRSLSVVLAYPPSKVISLTKDGAEQGR